MTLGVTVTHLQIGDSATATQNFMLGAQKENGSLLLQRGNSMAATQNILSINKNNVIKLEAGLLQFPATQVPSTDPNTLDDYKEGTWTPAFSLATPGTSSFGTYVTQVGKYSKIGNTVIAQFYLKAGTFALGTGTGNIRISLPPFTVSATGGVAGEVGMALAFTTNAPDSVFAVAASQYVELYALSGTSHVVLNQTNCATNMEIFGTVTYYV